MEMADKRQLSLGTGPSEEELNGAEKVFSSLVLACNNLSFYPYGHTISNNYINQFHQLLVSFLQKFGSLKYEIERESIRFKERAVSVGIPKEGTLHFSLFQVGILWMEFLKGIELEETKSILFVLDKYSKILVESDGDIVTAFWEAQFPHLQYEVAEFSWVDDHKGEGVDKADIPVQKVREGQQRVYREDPGSKEDRFLTHAQVILTGEEKASLKDMIRREERADVTGYLDILLDSLLHHREKENYNVILGVLSEEFSSSLVQKEFVITFKILHGLRYIQNICRSETLWADPLLETFFSSASREFHTPLKEVWRELKAEDAGILGQLFKLFEPPAVQSLVSLLSQNQPRPLQQILLESILFLALKDMAPLEATLNTVEEDMIEKLIPVIVKLEGEQPLRCLISLARHPSPQVRNNAIKGILQRDPARAKELFGSIDQMEEEVRLLILEQMGRSRDKSVEELLLSYLRNIKFGKDEIVYLFLCFKTLGKCGMARSVSFLRETLFQGGVIPGFRNSVLRRGAVLALITMNNPDAEVVLEEASRSFNPSLRMVVKEVRRELQPRGKR